MSRSICFMGGFSSDLCSGAEAPVTKALRELQADCFEPLDIIHGQHCDLLNDDCFDRLLELSASGLIGAALAAPPCGDFSLLKLRSGRPRSSQDTRGTRWMPFEYVVSGNPGSEQCTPA